jgi:hypothetical protein
MVNTYSLKKDGEKKLQPNFRVREFASQCGADKILIDSVLVAFLQTLRDCLGLSSLKIVSGYRTPERNKAVGGSKNSQHMQGKAVDACPYKNGKKLHPKYLCCAAEILGMTGIALIQTCAHLDTRASRSWFDENKNNTRIENYGHKSWFTYCNVKNLNFMLNPFKKPTETLRKGAKGDSVKYLQFELVKRGYLSLVSSSGVCNVDGAFGSGTLAAVKAFQKAKGLTVDGIVGKNTWSKL